MKSRFIYLLCIILILCNSCHQQSTAHKEIKKTVGKALTLEFSYKTRMANGYSSLEELRHKYPNLSVVYLQNSCAPCYPKFIQWQKGLASIDLPENYSVLFIIQGDRYQQFIDEVNDYAFEHLDATEPKDNPYPVLMDPDFEYLASNTSIPQWIIDRSVLIDKDNRIRMVGEPWASEEMTELLYKICNN